MSDQSLGDRMKGFEHINERYLTPRIPLCLRIDGRAFHSWTRGLERPFDENLKKCMVYATYKLCKNLSGCVFGYTQSDEISLVLIDYQNENTEGWFKYRSNKMESVSASIATAAFAEASLKYLPEHTMRKGFATFDSRAWSLPVGEVCNMFLWRQRDCEKNSVSSLAQAHFSHKQLHGKNGSDMQDMLMLEKNINWNDVPTYNKRGVALFRATYEKPNPVDPSVSVERSVWLADMDMPILSKNRLYIDHLLRVPSKEPLCNSFYAIDVTDPKYQHCEDIGLSFKI